MSDDKPQIDKVVEETVPTSKKNEAVKLSRRRVLQGASGSIALATLAACDSGSVAQGPAPTTPTTAGISAEPAPRDPDLTGRLARYMVDVRDTPLPPNVVLAAKHRILDSIGAVVSGAQLLPGEVAIDYIRGQGGTEEAYVATTDIMTSATNAAFANGMFGHADETDDFHPFTKAHPGCVVIPAALAMGQKEGSSGTEFLRAVVLGYDLCCRFLVALQPALIRARGRAAEGYSSTFGATATAASLARFNETEMRYAISYAVQQVSGVWSWVRDVEHIEKAFDFSGMGARNGVAAATMIQSGFTGVLDALEGQRNIIDAQSVEPSPEEMVADLGSRFYIEETAIKTFPTGYPTQSPLAAFFTLREQYGITADNLEHLLIRLPEDGARIVDNRSMPDINAQHLMAVAVVDGYIDFENSHSFERMSDPEVLAVKERIEYIADPELAVVEAPRSGFVQITLTDGQQADLFVSHAPGTPENPLDTEAVNEKVRTLVAPILGDDRTETLIDRINNIEDIDNIQELRPLISNTA